MIHVFCRIGPLVRTFRSDERGGTMALIAISLVWIVGMAALVVDIGDGWLSRQTLIPATDAAALAAAQDMVIEPWDTTGACDTAERYVLANAPEAAMTNCQVVQTTNGGRVTVGASDELEANLTEPASGPVDVISSSTVTWGPPLTITGLRPFGLCYDGSAALRHLLDNPPTSRTWVRITYTKDDPDDCGGPAAAGNFATIDFETNSPVYDIRDWMLNGYQQHIDLDPPSITNCLGNAVCFDRPYASSDIRWEIDSLRNSETYVSFPVFNYADADHVHLVGLVRARFYKYVLDGPSEDWWIELKVEPGLVAGKCCGPAGLLSGNKTIAICGVDPGPYEGTCEPVGGS